MTTYEITLNFIGEIKFTGKNKNMLNMKFSDARFIDNRMKI